MNGAPLTFDSIPREVVTTLESHREVLTNLEWLLVNRDLNGRVRLIAPERVQSDEALRQGIEDLAATLAERLGVHGYPASRMVLYEASQEQVRRGAAIVPLGGFENVFLVDRLATEGDWANIADESPGPPRVVFFSIKGGVGRSTALAATAWWLAQAGKRVLVVDLDLESPGLSSSLLPTERLPRFGVTDWLVEDLVENAEIVFKDMIATSGLAHDGEIIVVPAHGAEPGEYIAKLGRVWMPRVGQDGSREAWFNRLRRLLAELEAHLHPDVVLLDCRAGLDEVASACIAQLGARLVLLFALDGTQTWNGYRMLFEHWRRAQVTEKIRERLQTVAALVPEMERVSYLDGLREHAHEVFRDTLYDEIPPAPEDDIGQEHMAGGGAWRVKKYVEGWNFDEADEQAPHAPWAVNWHRSFAGLYSLQGRLATIDTQEVRSIFGNMIDGIANAIGLDNNGRG